MAQKKTTTAADKKTTILQAPAEKPAKVSRKPAAPKPAVPKHKPTKSAPSDAKKPVTPVIPATPAIKPAASDASSAPEVPKPSRPCEIPQGDIQVTVHTPAAIFVTPRTDMQFTVSPPAITFDTLFPNHDVFFFSGEIRFPIANEWSKIVREANKKTKHEGVFVFFCSCGGDPNESFRMMRLLQKIYKDINVVVFGRCYSAATLFALGANKIYMSEDAQLGPLDVQISKEDDNSFISGECYRQALITLGGMSSTALKELFKKLKSEMGFPVSTHTASRVASEIVVWLFAPIAQQIEPARLGSVMRDQGIGYSYGIRLMKDRYSPASANNIASRLAYGYPSHSTVIDFEEAQSLGLHVEKISTETFYGGWLKNFSESLLVESERPQKGSLSGVVLQK